MHNGIHNNNNKSFGFYRIEDVLRIIPVCKTTWYNGIKTGAYPSGYKISQNVSAWDVNDIHELIERITSQNSNISN